MRSNKGESRIPQSAIHRPKFKASPTAALDNVKNKILAIGRPRPLLRRLPLSTCRAYFNAPCLRHTQQERTRTSALRFCCICAKAGRIEIGQVYWQREQGRSKIQISWLIKAACCCIQIPKTEGRGPKELRIPNSESLNSQSLIGNLKSDVALTPRSFFVLNSSGQTRYFHKAASKMQIRK